MISLIWAMDENNLIGDKDRIPWHYKEDLLYFKEKTAGKTVLMGDATYHSLKGYYKSRPLPYGKMYVGNLNETIYDDATCVTDVISFLRDIDEDIIVIGGRTIYKLSLPFADKLYITFIKKSYEGDTYFPDFNLGDYKLISKRESNELIFTVYERNI